MKLYVGNRVTANLECLCWVYAHGKLARKAGTDLLNFDKKKHFDRRRNVNGEECIAVLPSGEEKKAVFFYWKSVDVRVYKMHFPDKGTYRKVYVQPRGLLCLKEDKKAIQYAQECFNERSRFL